MPPPGGVCVSFKDNATEALLWKANMHSVPVKDEICTWTDTLGVIREYEVNRVEYEFTSPVPIGEDPPIRCQHMPVVYVTVQ
jgi:hypothetical protein